jgi:type II secretory pathway pseudopilin PulG
MSPVEPLKRILNQERGSALLIMLTIIGLGAAFLLVSALNKANQKIERDKITSAALAQAKEALIGYAATYRDTHPNEVFGYLPCPDTDNDGQSEANCGAADVSTIGRLPWNSLSLPALRDSGGECLWLAVSGNGKNSPKTTIFNWDTVGQIEVRDASGQVLAAQNTHAAPLALILGPQTITGGQTRTSAGTTVCGGSTTATDYLEGAVISPTAGVTSTITLSTASSVTLGTNNDQGLWITGKEIFDRIKKRSDFKSDIDSMLDDLSTCLNGKSSASLPSTSAGNKGIDNVITDCPAAGAQKINMLTNWRDNLLYTKPASAATVNGATGCNAVLFFSGERTASQSRATAAEKLIVTNYLEGTNATIFPNTGSYLGNTNFNSVSTSTDLVRCITGLAAVPTQKSFAADFTSFVTAGVGLTTNATDKTITVTDATGSSGGCFWFPDPIPLAGKIIRSYYDYQFSFADTHALTGTGPDRGYGFTFQMVRNDIGSPTGICGRETNMGALDSGDPWGLKSLIIETDVHRNNADADPIANHTAIMANGDLLHSALNGNTTAACNGTAAGCRHNPANKFEESATPLPHNQRIEIHTGCNSTCATCDPTNHAAPNTYARITAWVDCTDCNDIIVDLDRAAKTPTINRCLNLDTELSSVYFTFTGGFRTGTARQGITIQNFQIRSE